MPKTYILHNNNAGKLLMNTKKKQKQKKNVPINNEVNCSFYL